MLIVYGLIDEIPENNQGGDLSFYTVKKINGAWNIEGMTRDKKSINFTFGPNDVISKPDIAVLKINKKNQPYVTWTSVVYNDKVGDSFINVKYPGNTDSPAVASFFIEEDLTIHCVVYSSAVKVINNNEFEVVVEEQTKQLFAFDMVGKYPLNLSKFVTKVRSKINLLNQVSVTDSVAALEAQVDFLSLMIIQLMDSIPEENRPAWLPQLKNIVNSYGVQHTHSVEKMLTDIMRNKKLLTELRESYINSLQ